MFKIRCVLHPTDFSDYSRNAFPVAVAMARDHGARLLILHVAQHPVARSAGVVPLEVPAATDPELVEAELRKIQPAEPGLDVEHRLAEGDPAGVILDVARQVPCDMIVMGTHGRTGLARLLMGTVAEKVVRNANCPVLTVKMPMREGKA